MAALKTKMNALVGKIDEALTDLTTLDVVTVSGDITLIMKGDRYLKPKEIVSTYFNKANAKVKIKAFYHVDFDQDTVQFVADDLGEGDLLYKVHNEAIASAKHSRQAMLNFVKEVVEG